MGDEAECLAMQVRARIDIEAFSSVNQMKNYEAIYSEVCARRAGNSDMNSSDQLSLDYRSHE
jgi:hypothetical protein